MKSQARCIPALGTAACLLLATAVPGQGSLLRTAEKVAFAPRAGAPVPLDLHFIADDGSDVDLASCCAGRPTVLALVYYRCPMLCNLVVEGLLRSLASVSLTPGSDYDVVLVSIDPAETAAAARRRRQLVQQQSTNRQGGAGWSFLTGSEQNIKALADSVGFHYVHDVENDQYAHGAGIVLLDRHGAVRRFLGGVDYPPNDLRLGLVESSDGQAGTVIDRLLLLCYQYDPTTGRYGVAIFALLRGLGILTLLGIGGGVGLMLWRERRCRAVDPRRGPPDA